MNKSIKEVQIYSDGACSGNPGPGGWAAILLYENAKKQIYGAEKETTNNRMELMAAIKGLNALKHSCKVELFTDSAYLHNAFSKGWLESWQRRNWLRADKKPVMNQDLWQELLRLSSIHDITWRKVKGHSDNKYNNECDVLARKAITELEKPS